MEINEGEGTIDGVKAVCKLLGTGEQTDVRNIDNSFTLIV